MIYDITTYSYSDRRAFDEAVNAAVEIWNATPGIGKVEVQFSTTTDECGWATTYHAHIIAYKA